MADTRTGPSTLAILQVVMFLGTLLVGVAPPAHGSQVEGSAQGQREGMTRTGSGWSWPSDARRDTLWTWPEEQLGIVRSPNGFRTLDLADGESKGAIDLNPAPWFSHGPNGASSMAAGREHTATLDRSSGLFYVPYQRPFRNSAPFPLAVDLEWPNNVVRMAAERQLCLSAQQFHSGGGCIGGYHVIDVRSMELVNSVRLDNVQADLGLGVAPILRAIVHSPPKDGEPAAGKLYVVAEDMVTHAEANLIFTSQYSRNLGQASITRVAQIDAASGRVDWVQRLEACRGTRDEHTDLQWAMDTMNHPWPTVAMRSTLPGDQAVYVGCNNGGSRQAVVVRIPVDAQGFAYGSPVELDSTKFAEGSGPPDPNETVRRSPRQQAFPGPEYGLEWRADPIGNRILARVNGASTELWWIFDIQERAYVGAIGIGKFARKDGAVASFDPDAGRLYVLATAFNGGTQTLFSADVRRNPIAQALTYVLPERVNAVFAESGRVTGGPRRLYALQGDYVSRWLDHVPVSEGNTALEIEGGTLDLDEQEGVTAVAFDGTARGYGARVLLVGGLQAIPRMGPIDAFTTTHDYYNFKVGGRPDPPPWNPCLLSNREIVLAFVGPESTVSMSSGNSSGAVQPLAVDPNTAADGHRPARCGPVGWEDIWRALLFGRSPAEQPEGVPSWLVDSNPSCVTGESETWRDEASGSFAGHINCEEEEASGWAQARGVQVGPFSVSEAVSSFRIYLDPGRGLVARVESVARGVILPGSARIDTVRGTAESWANGRRQPMLPEERESGYEPNCDQERTAGTCFARHIFGFWSPSYSCGPCGDETAFLNGLNQALGTEGRAHFREPDELLARGSENGYAAAILKRDSERFADLMMNEDLLQTTLPTLEIVHYASPTQYGPSALGDPNTHPPRGRQIIQLAGVEVSTTYGIECLLSYDAARNVCAPPSLPSAALVVQLQDPAGAVIEGGALEVYEDIDADGVLGLADPMISDGVCVTSAAAPCRWELPEGAYFVSQTTAAPGYIGIAEPHSVELVSGEERTVTFVNELNRASVVVSAELQDGAPAVGAVFTVYPDHDGDGSADGEAAASCRTGADGTCRMTVPVGGYLLMQESAQSGTLAIEPVSFVFTAAGQAADIAVVLESDSGSYSALAPIASPTYRTSDEAPGLNVQERSVELSQPISSVSPTVARPIGGTIVRVLRAPGDILRLALRTPSQAVAWVAALALFLLAYMAVGRRRRLLALLQ